MLFRSSLDGQYAFHSPVKVHYTTAIVSHEKSPDGFELYANFPNPFNPSTTIKFNLNQAQTVSLAIYDMRGHLVKMLLNQECSAGMHQAVWDGTDVAGGLVASGLYIYKIEAGAKSETKQILLLR